MTDDLKTVEGNIASIDHQNRRFALEDKDGVIFISILWQSRFDQYMQKQKVGYYEKPTISMKDGHAVLEDIRFAQRPPEWTRQKKQGGASSYDPLKDKRIAFQGVLNAAIATLELSSPFNEEEGDEMMDAYTVLKIQKVYLQALDQYLEKGADGINTSPPDQ